MSERSEAIRLKVMADGHIRAYDAVKRQGVAEWYVDCPWGGVCLGLYNQAAYEKVCCTVTTRINLSNHYWVLTAKRIE